MKPILAILMFVLLASTLPAAQPNIVFILADDMGYGDLGCYGHPTAKTPVIDQLARDGVGGPDVVPRQHHHFQTHAPQSGEPLKGLRLDRVCHGYQTHRLAVGGQEHGRFALGRQRGRLFRQAVQRHAGVFHQCQISEFDRASVNLGRDAPAGNSLERSNRLQPQSLRLGFHDDGLAQWVLGAPFGGRGQEQQVLLR